MMLNAVVNALGRHVFGDILEHSGSHISRHLFILSIEQMRKSGSLALWARLEFMGKPYLATYIN